MRESVRAFFLGVQSRHVRNTLFATTLERLWAFVESTETSGELAISLVSSG
jgi:hypothetical protein